jgi:hypothetical protein
VYVLDQFSVRRMTIPDSEFTSGQNHAFECVLHVVLNPLKDNPQSIYSSIGPVSSLFSSAIAEDAENIKNILVTQACLPD